MTVFLNYEFIDEDCEREKEFENVDSAKSWLKGHREEDFNFVEMVAECGSVIAETYSEIVEF